jgi:hypothetical protein
MFAPFFALNSTYKAPKTLSLEFINKLDDKFSSLYLNW